MGFPRHWRISGETGFCYLVVIGQILPGISFSFYVSECVMQSCRTKGFDTKVDAAKNCQRNLRINKKKRKG
jgi:hypothetical protein